LLKIKGQEKTDQKRTQKEPEIGAEMRRLPKVLNPVAEHWPGSEIHQEVKITSSVNVTV